MKDSSGFSNRYSRPTPTPAATSAASGDSRPTRWGNRVRPASTDTVGLLHAGAKIDHPLPQEWASALNKGSSFITTTINPPINTAPLPPSYLPPFPSQLLQHNNVFLPTPPSHPPPHPLYQQQQQPPPSLQQQQHQHSYSIEQSKTSFSASFRHSGSSDFSQQMSSHSSLSVSLPFKQQHQQSSSSSVHANHVPSSEIKRQRQEARADREREWANECERLYQESLIDLQDGDLLIKQKEVHKRRAKGESWMCLHEIDLPFEQEPMTRTPSQSSSHHKHNKEDRFKERTFAAFSSAARSSSRDPRLDQHNSSTDYLLRLRSKIRHTHNNKCEYNICTGSETTCESWTLDTLAPLKMRGEVVDYEEKRVKPPSRSLSPTLSPRHTNGNHNNNGNSKRSASREPNASGGSWSPPSPLHERSSSRRSQERHSSSRSAIGSWSKDRSSSSTSSSDTRNNWANEGWARNSWEGGGWVGEGGSWDNKNGSDRKGGHDRRNQVGNQYGNDKKEDTSRRGQRKDSWDLADEGMKRSNSGSARKRSPFRDDRRDDNKKRTSDSHSWLSSSAAIAFPAAAAAASSSAISSSIPISAASSSSSQCSSSSTSSSSSSLRSNNNSPTIEDQVKEVEEFVKGKLIDAASRRLRSKLEGLLFTFLGRYKAPPPPPSFPPPTSSSESCSFASAAGHQTVLETPKTPVTPSTPNTPRTPTTPSLSLPPPALSASSSISELQTTEENAAKKPRTKEEKLKAREEKAARKEAKRLKREKRERRKAKQEAKAKRLEEQRANGEVVEGASQGEVEGEEAGEQGEEAQAGEQPEGEQQEEAGEIVEEGAIEHDGENAQGEETKVEDHAEGNNHGVAAEVGEGVAGNVEGNGVGEEEEPETESEEAQDDADQVKDKDDQEEDEEAEREEDIEMPPNYSGCARCEPWDEAKPRLWEWRRRRARLEEAAAVAAARASSDNLMEQGVQTWGSSVFLGGGIPDESVLIGASSRASRNSKRKQATQMAYIQDDANAFLVNQLQRRHKSIRIFNSAIHDCGVFAEVPIEPEEVVVEYLGELVRGIIADRREAMYQKEGIDSSYMFRLDKNLIIDATKKGGLARFLNHSCDPNCYTREIMHSNTERIVIYSRKKIAKGEELTYDYKFPLEDVKIPCRCGAKTCRGTLN